MFLMHCADVFDENAPRSAWDYFRLGTAIHYIADAFTASHNGFWTGSLLEHSAYETVLHREFKAMLKSACPEQIPRREYAPLHRVYRTEKHNVEIDFRYILTVCLSVMQNMFSEQRSRRKLMMQALITAVRHNNRLPRSKEAAA